MTISLLYLYLNTNTSTDNMNSVYSSYSIRMTESVCKSANTVMHFRSPFTLLAVTYYCVAHRLP